MWYSLASDCICFAIWFILPNFFLFRPKYWKDRPFISYSIMVVLSSVYLILFRYVWDFFIQPVYYIGFTLTLTSLWYFLYGVKGKKLILSYLLLMVFGITQDLFATILTNLVNPTYIQQYFQTYKSYANWNMGHIMSVLMGETLMMILVLIYFCLIQRKQVRLFFGFLCVPIYHIFIMAGFYLLCTDYSQTISSIGLAMAVFNLLLDGLIMYFLHTIFKKQDMESEIRELEEKRLLEQAYYEADSRFTEEMRMIRHDFANQLQIVYGMMEAKEDPEEIRKVLLEMKKDLGEM